MTVNQLCYLKEYNEAVIYKRFPSNSNLYKQHLKLLYAQKKKNLDKASQAQRC